MTKPPLMTSEENKNKYSQICAWMVRTIWHVIIHKDEEKVDHEVSKKMAE